MTKGKSRFIIVFVLLTALMLQLVPVAAFAAGRAALYANAEAVEANARAAHAIAAIDYDGASRLTVRFKTTPPTVSNRYNFWLTDKSGSTIYFKSISKTADLTWSIELYSALLDGKYTLHFKSNDPAHSFTVSSHEPVPTAEPAEAPTAEPTAQPTQAPTAEPTAEPSKAPLLTSIRFETDHAEVMTRDSTAIRIYGFDQYGDPFDLSGVKLEYSVELSGGEAHSTLAENRTFSKYDTLFSIYRVNGKPRLMALAGMSARLGTWQITVYAEGGLRATAQVRIVENPNPIVWPAVSTPTPTPTPTPAPTPAPTPTPDPTPEPEPTSLPDPNTTW